MKDTNQGHAARLVCWSCGAGKDVVMPHEPRFAFEIVGAAHAVGMVGYFDTARGRTLVFCNPSCARDQLTRQGAFRLRPKKVAA